MLNTKNPLILLLLVFFYIMLNPIESKAEFKINIRNYHDFYLAGNLNRFPIQQPRPLNFNGFNCYTNEIAEHLVGTSIITNYNIKEFFYFAQHSNDNGNICNSTSNTNFCNSSDLININTPTSNVCYNKQTKEFKINVNVINQPYKGCYIHKDQENVENPGGYDIYASTNFDRMSQIFKTNFLTINNLEAIYFNSQSKFLKYNQQNCPIPGPNGLQPYAGGTPAAFPLNSIMLYNPIKKASLFYNLQTWDNREEFRDRDTPINTICNFPTTVGGVSFYLAHDSMPYYDLPPLNTNSIHNYTFDVLPRLEKAIKDCDSADNLSNWIITGSYFGNELLNATELGISFKNPKITFIQKPYDTTNPFKPLYEIECKVNTDRVYITSKQEVASAVANGCINRGVIGYIHTSNIANSLPIFRLWSNVYFDNFYTTNEAEKNLAVANGWEYIGIVGYILNSQQKNTKPLYRLLDKNSYAQMDRILTPDPLKKQYLLTKNFTDEGIIGYIFTINEPSKIVGDFNLDGSTTVTDINLLKNLIFNLNSNSDLDLYDINFTGNIDLKDLVLSVENTY